MNKHKYTLALKELDTDFSVLFEIGSHDNLFEILEGMSSNTSLDENSRNALIVGAKSIGYAIMANKESEIMSSLMPHFKELMKELKRGVSGNR